MFQSPKYLTRLKMGVFSISRFLVISLINKDYHNSRTGDDIAKKLGPLTKLHKRNTTTSKKDKDVMLANYVAITIPMISSRFGGI